jgi:pimeloyl-ACP methyl ester carboxylesterase/DNA-binding CsgD family transcriptional regulator
VPVPEQAIRFAEVDGRQIAWASVGEGPPLLAGSWWMSHLELNWASPRFRDFALALARHRTVIRYDLPGTGLSGNDAPPVTLQENVELLSGFLDVLGAERVELFAGSGGGPIAACYAAEHPERVKKLALFGTYATGADIGEPREREATLNLVRTHWGLGSRMLADVFMPSATAAEREEFVEFQRGSGPADLAARWLQSVFDFDLGELPARIQVPTLVMHRSGDRAVPFDLGRGLASRIPGATFVALDGTDHFPWFGDAAAVARAVLEFVGVDNPQVEISAPTGGDGIRTETELSDRELTVLKLVAAGLSDSEIAERLVLSPHTVHRHVANIRTKLGLPSRAAAAAHAARLGLI